MFILNLIFDLIFFLWDKIVEAFLNTGSCAKAKLKTGKMGRIIFSDQKQEAGCYFCSRLEHISGYVDNSSIKR